MKWIKLLSIIICLSISYSIYGQVSAKYIPLSEYNMSDKVVYVRFLFVLKEWGTDGYPGNFSPINDGGLGGTILNGEDFADKLIARANLQLSRNRLSRYFIGSTPPPNYDPKFRFQKATVSEYIENNELYNTAIADADNGVGAYINSEERKNMLTVVIQQVPGSLVSGLGPEWGCLLSSPWLYYKQIIEESTPDNIQANIDWGITVLACLLCHELGHSLGLPHAFCESGHAEAGPSDLMCDDIPTFAELGLTYDQVCGWGNPLNNNNLMTHGGNGNIDFAITPCQLGLIQYNLCHSYLGKWLHPDVPFPVSITVNSSNTSLNKPYPVLGESIITTGNVILQAEKPTLFVFSNNVKLNKGFKVPRGATFSTVKINKDIIIKSAKTETDNNSAKKAPVDKENDRLFSVFPSPSDGLITIRSPEPAEINIYSATGKLVYSKLQKLGSFSVDLSDQAPGVYLINFIGTTKSLSKKIIIK